jgi:hypothetical protein
MGAAREDAMSGHEQSMTQAGKVRLGNMVDPKYTLGAAVEKAYLA